MLEILSATSKRCLPWNFALGKQVKTGSIHTMVHRMCNITEKDMLGYSKANS